jgi:hypothetical protein
MRNLCTTFQVEVILDVKLHGCLNCHIYMVRHDTNYFVSLYMKVYSMPLFTKQCYVFACYVHVLKTKKINLSANSLPVEFFQFHLLTV